MFYCIHLFFSSVYTCVGSTVHMWKSEDALEVLSFPRVGPRDGTPVLKCLFPLNLLPSTLGR